MSRARAFKVGDLVRLKRGLSSKKGPRISGRIVRFMHDIEGGVVIDTALDGQFHMWNVEHLERLKREDRHV